MSICRSRLAGLAPLCALVGFLVFASAPAGATDTHHYLPAVSATINEGIPVEGPHGEKIALPGLLKLGPLSMTTDSGHLWAVEGSERVDEFDAATGAFLSQPIIRPEGTVFGAQDGPAGIALGHATGEGVVYMGERTSTGTAVAVYSESGTLKGTWTGAETPAKAFSSSGSFSEKESVAVDNSTDPLDEHKGDVYVSYWSEGRDSGVVDIFHPEADGKEHYVGQITGPSPSELFKGVRRMTVDSANGDVIVITENAVDILEPAALGEYVLVHKITGPPSGPFGEAYNISVDGVSGDIYVDDLGTASTGVLIDQFSSAGAYLGRITGEETPHGKIFDVFAIAVDPESHNVYVGDVNAKEMDVFGPNIVFPDVTTEPASNVMPFGATLNGAVNPDKAEAGAVTCRFEWGTTRVFGNTAPCEPEGVAEGGSPVPVHAALSGLQPDTTYFYRLQATNGNGTNPGEASQDQEFTTPGPGFHDESVTNLADTSVTFDASINPHKVPSSVYFQYGTSAGYGSDVPAPPGEVIGSGEGDVDVTPHHVQGLQPGTVYHYRVVVVTEPKAGEVVVFDGPDQVFTTETAAVAELPDGRHWEMVSPPDKKGAQILPIEAEAVVQAADSGGAITYLADSPTEAEPQGSSNLSQVLSTRGPGGWGTRDVGLPHVRVAAASVGEGEEYRFFSSDLSLAVVQPFGGFNPGLSAEASESTAMLRSLDASCANSCYRPLVTGKQGFANVPTGTVFGQEPEGECPELYCGPNFYDATPDLSHIIFFIPGQRPGERSLGTFEWAGGKLTPPIDVLPDGTQGNLSVGGERNPRGAISRDGSRVVLVEPSGNIYMRETAAASGKTVQLNVAEPSCVAKGKCTSEGGATFQLANADGSRVFFTDENRLTKGASPTGPDLYECEIVAHAGELECKLSDIASETLGMPGASEDGSYLYFVANSVLAEGAVPGECAPAEARQRPGATCNLYVRHGGVTKFVALLSSEDSRDWTVELVYSSVRVSPDGNWLEFMSQRSVTGYNNRDAVSGRPDAEVYLYDASTGRVACASCDPTGARPTGEETPPYGAFTGGPLDAWNGGGWVAANVPGWLQMRGSGDSVHQPRYLSDSGRLFFDSGDALVPQDVNGTQDVYEYEPPGVGDCTTVSPTYSAHSGGCVGLISSGTSAKESGFLDASENGGDVFILTFSRLQPQDYDSTPDVYDAHECTSAVPCFPTPIPQPPACTTAEACRAAPSPQPADFGAPSSATFSGAGNIAPGSGGVVRAKSLTRAQQLAGALKACKRKPKKRRAVCERHARAQYRSKNPAKAAAKKGKR